MGRNSDKHCVNLLQSHPDQFHLVQSYLLQFFSCSVQFNHVQSPSFFLLYSPYLLEIVAVDRILK